MSPSSPKLRSRRGVAPLLVVLAFALSLVSGASPARSDHYDRYWTAQGTFLCDNPAFHDPDHPEVHNPAPIVGARVEFYQAANSTIDNLYTGFRDGLQQVGVDVPGHDPLDHLIGSTHTDANGSWSFHLHAVGDTGDPPFYARLVLDDDKGVRLFDGWSKFFDSWSVETARAGNNGKVVDYGTYEIARDGGSKTPKCAVWQGAHNAYQDYIAETGQTPPSVVHWISYGWPTATPFTTLGQTNWPEGYVTTHGETDAAGHLTDGGYSIDFHEFGHDIRHSLDGGEGEFLKDVVRYDYPQKHEACKLAAGDTTGKLGFAFNEGWAEFWAGTPATCDFEPHNYQLEGNVAAALTALTVGSPVCPAVSRAGLVKVLAANPGRIHSWDEFLTAFRSLHPCDRISPKARLRTPPIGWGGESIPLSARTLKGQTRIELSQARTALGRLGQLIRRNPVGRASGCPPNCAIALGQAAAPSLLATMRAQLQLVQHEIQLERAGATGDPLWRQLTTAKGIARADSDAHTYARASIELTTAAIAKTLKTAIPLARKRNAQLSREIGALRDALRGAQTARPGRLSTWIEGVDSDLHRRIGPSRLPTPTQLTLSCPAAATTASQATVSGRLTPALANQSITVQVSGGPGGGSQTATTRTDGSYTANFTPGATGTYTIRADYAGTSAYRPSTANCTMTVTNAPQTRLSLNCPTTASPAQPVTVTAQLSPPLAEARIDLSASGPGTVPSQTVTTNTSGLASSTFTIGTAGTWTVTANWAGDTAHQAASANCSIAVRSPSTLTLTCPSRPLPPNTPVSVNGTLAPAVNASPVSVAYTPPTNSGQPPATDHLTTDDTGYYADSYGEKASGSWTATATFAGDSTRAPSTATCTFTVLSP